MSDIPEYIDFINGELDSDSERKFAERFSIDEEFRSGFRSYLTIANTINGNMKRYTPAPGVTKSVFANLGLQFFPDLTTPVKNIHKMPFLKTRLFTGLVSGIAGVVMALLFAVIFLMPKTKAASQPITLNNDPLGILNKLIKESGSVKNEEKVHIQTITKYIYKEKKYQDKQFEHIETKPETQIISTASTSSNNISLFNAKTAIRPIDYRIFIAENNKETEKEIDMVTSKTNERIGLIIEVKNLANWNIPKETVYPSYYVQLFNMDYSLLYELSDRFSLGANFRRESFFLKYSGKESDNIIYDYQQQPNLASFALLARYKFLDYQKINSFLQLSAGGNKIGYVARPMLGFSINPVDNVSFIFGAEYGMLWFYHLNNWFNSSKFSLNYGVNYKF